ncbi:hypothetical protein NH340_JMT07305 [Sarcoptes scabiei]|nr:hypothetical protein NH340_JMT07305 [Sarcoptes scabiei]
MTVVNQTKNETKSSSTTTFKALMALLKCYIGTGILSMPLSFSFSGYLNGLVGTCLIGLLCNYCNHMLVQINNVLLSSETQNINDDGDGDENGSIEDRLPYDYCELASMAFERGPRKLRRFSQQSQSFLSVCLCITQLGFCCSYALFIARNLLQFAINLKLIDWTQDDIVYVIMALLPIMIVLNFIKNIHHLAMLSTFANLIQTTSLLIIIYNLVTGSPVEGERKIFNSKIPQFVSTTFFTFEGITVVSRFN